MSRKRKTDRQLAEAWFKTVTKGKHCVVCHQKNPLMEAHHVVQQQVLRREFPHGAWWDQERTLWRPLRRGEDPAGYEKTRTLQEILWDVRNGLPVCPKDHEHHTSHSYKLPRSVLHHPAIVFVLTHNLESRIEGRFYA